VNNISENRMFRNNDRIRVLNGAEPMEIPAEVTTVVPAGGANGDVQDDG